MNLKAAVTLAIALIASPAHAAMCKSSGDNAEQDAIRAEREAFNRAIGEKDIDAIARVLLETATLVTGTASDRFDGRLSQIALWRADFEKENRAIYVRTSDCVRVSEKAPVALEIGRWRGARVNGAENFAAGSYAAKWRRADGAWRIESEIFSTEDCGGDFCPAAEKAE